MRKTIKLQDLDCANCAAKMEAAIAKLDGVTEVSVNFMGQKMILDAADDKFENIVAETKKIARKIDPDITVVA